MSIRLKNPHSVLAIIETRPEDLLQIILPSSHAAGGDAWDRVVKFARERKVPVTAGAARPAKDASKDMGRLSSIEAVVKEREPLSSEELFASAPDRAGGKGLWLALDCLQDPHNVGAIFRVAGFFGVEGIILTQERSAPLSSTVYDVASGGLEYVPFAIQPNLQRGFEVAKEAGLWILGTSEHASDDLQKIERDRPWLVVMGNEEKGMRRLTEETCDLLCKISPRGKVLSLNVSVAAGILISHFSSSKR